MNTARLQHLKHFYVLLGALEEKLGGPRRLSECAGRMDWPRRGVYFFREPGEDRSDTGDGPRIVRIGTHALRAGSGTKLWGRLSQHRGQIRAGGGSHRGSIFRLLMGASIIERDGQGHATWGQGTSAPKDFRIHEEPLEKAVSAVIGAMPFLWLEIDDEPGPESLRGYIERNSIALLSNFSKPPLDLPSPNWLGHSCPRPRVQESGLWNQNHVEVDYDPAFLDQLERLVASMRSAP
ncbi:MAG: hypothetical protein RH942_03905 [Kiloniellaceae bacterium]